MTNISTIDILDFKHSIRKYVESVDFPLELKRLVLQELVDDFTELTKTEAIRQAEERETNQNGG